jgi:hypothetical protein
MSLTITKGDATQLEGTTLRIDNTIAVTLSEFSSIAGTQVALFSPDGIRLTALVGTPESGSCTLQCATQEMVDFFSGLPLSDSHEAVLVVGLQGDVEFQCNLKVKLNPFFSSQVIYPVLTAVLSVNHGMPDGSGNVNLLDNETMVVIGNLFDPDALGADINTLSGIQLSEQIANIIRVLKHLDVRTS